MTETLSCCLHPESSEAAIILAGKNPTTITHAGLADNVLQIQRQLQACGLYGGKHIAIVLSNPYSFTVTFLATTLQACVAGPLSHSLKAPEYEFYYKDFNADVVVLGEDDVSKSSQAYVAAQSLQIPIATVTTKKDRVIINLPDLSDSSSLTSESEKVSLDATMVALILHTSGTTGRPKAVPLSHGNISKSIANIREHYQLTPSDRTPVIMPLYHIHGIVCALLTPLTVGAAVIFSGTTIALTPSFFRDAATHRATWYTASPTLHRLVLKLPGAEPLFRFVRSCSSPLDANLLKQMEDKLQCIVVEAYAMTEAAHQVCSNPVSQERRLGSVGVPTGVEVKILGDDGVEVDNGQVGEVCIKGPNVMRGYIGNDEANLKSFTDSWFRTGDQGKLVEGDFLVLTGRLKELINKGGEKISPVEIDDVVNRHESVAEAVTFAIPDELYGEDVAVAVVLETGQETTEKELKAWIRDRLALAKVPQKVFFVEQIPKTSVGKMQRSLVAKTILQQEGRIESSS